MVFIIACCGAIIARKYNINVHKELRAQILLPSSKKNLKYSCNQYTTVLKIIPVIDIANIYLLY